MIYRGLDHRCVACATPLVADRVRGASCERCPRCCGIWIATEHFLALLAATPTAQRLGELMVHNDGSPRRDCPHCGRVMDLAWIDFLQLDQCEEHGVWLDAGELDKALASAQPNPELKALLEAMRPRSKR